MSNASMQTGAPTDGTPADQKIMIGLVLRSSKAHVSKMTSKVAR